ncbi:MAG TPA: hypothetical protein DIU15_20250 [Deltaproteobacteria bacterium]|nr:hypothetical protein [Deltaproteobacteria bacterium]HCP48381.1 hypothetical protein [Deltaproteobacteria bacterium]|tara:strand:- start:666 stop:1379 length:714 start_codon:yes stop_codon:yes gene_type:complete
MPKLVVFRGRRKEGSHDLVDQEYLVGRSEQADIRLENPLVSRRHAVVSFRGHSWRVVDLQTPNGVFVNGTKINEHELKPGDRIQMGQHILIFQATGDPDIDVSTVSGIRAIPEAEAEQTRVLPQSELMTIQERTADRMQAHLVLQVDGNRTEFALHGKSHFIGFDAGCDVRLPGSSIFGKQVAEIVRGADGEYSVVPLSALSPVRVNGKKVSAWTLQDRDRIELKGFSLTYFRTLMK